MTESKTHRKLILPERGARVAVAMSGGVDSTVAARRLIDKGYEVMAFHLILTAEPSGLNQARNAARLLGLDLEVLDLSSEFENLIVSPFIRAYTQGETPNPCVSCNPTIKFGLLWEIAQARGAEYLATGHYARLITSAGGQTPVLSRAHDRTKDQTYFLCRLTGQMLSRAIFPLADLSKIEVEKEAAKLGLPPRIESQDACFLAGENYRDFILSRLASQEITPGEFVNLEGRDLGRHRGLIHYTIGQRRALGIPGPEPYYVLALDPERNQIVLGTKEQTLSRNVFVRDLVWSFTPPEPHFLAKVQIRSRHRPALAQVRQLPDNRAEIVFCQPQSAITSGQAAAFYDDHLLLGGGWIEKRSTG